MVMPVAGVVVGRFTPVILYFCSAVGGFLAAVSDLIQKEEASAVVKMTSLSARYLGIEMQAVWILFLIVVLSLVLCLIFQPKDRLGAFVLGLGVIATIMTATPYKQPPTAETSSVSQKTVNYELSTPHLQLAAAIQSETIPANENFSVEIRNAGPTDTTVSISVFNARNEQEYVQKGVVSGFKVFRFRFLIPDLPNDGVLRYSIDVDGKRIAINESTANPSTPPVVVVNEREINTIINSDVQRSVREAVPQFHERLFKRFAW